MSAISTPQPVSHPHWHTVGTVAFWTGWILLMIVTLAYFVPWFVGWRRHVPNLGAVAVVNILAGWTFAGWVAALAMACRTVPMLVPISLAAPPRPRDAGPPALLP